MRDQKGSCNPGARFNETIVLEMRKMRRYGASVDEIVERFSANAETVRTIIALLS